MGAMNMEDDQGARAFLTALRESGASAADRKRLTAEQREQSPRAPTSPS
jgi:hypothetical protein